MALPYLEAFMQARTDLEKVTQQRRFTKLLTWYRRQSRLFAEANEEFSQRYVEWQMLLFLRKAADAASRLEIQPQEMIFTLVLAILKISDAIDKSGLRDLELRGLPETEIAALSTLLGDVTRNAIAAMATSNDGRVQNLGPFYTWLNEWAQTTDNDSLAWINSSIEDEDVLGAIMRDGFQSTFIAPDRIQDLGDKFELISKEHDRRIAAFVHIRDRIGKMRERVMKPLTDTLHTNAGWGLVSLLCMPMALRIRSTFSPTQEPGRDHDLEIRLGGMETIKTASADPMFWYVALTSTLRDSGAMLGYGLRGWAIELIALLIKHPAQVRRANVPDEAMRTRSLLAKWFAPMLIGFHPRDAIADDIVALGSARSDESLALFAEYLATLSDKPDGASAFRNRDHERSIRHLWDCLIGPAFEEILVWIAHGVKVSADLLPPNDAALENSDDVWRPVEPVINGEADLADDNADELPRIWYFVRNPAAQDLDLVPIEIPAHRGEVAFEGLLRAQGVESLIKPESIMNAIDYFLSKSAIQQAVSPYEDLGGHRWHKIKRGRMRIYVHVEPDGRLLFHPYARKDWRQDLVNFSRRAA